MRELRPGQRVELVCITDSWTKLRPGDRGTVSGEFSEWGGLPVRWDSGSRLSVLPDQGDRVQAVNEE